MKRIWKSLGAFALSLTLLGLGTVSLAAVSAVEGGGEAEYAGYLLKLDTTAAIALTGSETAELSGLNLAAEEEMEELLLISDELGLYKAGTLGDIQNLVYAGYVTEVEPDYKAELFDVEATTEYLVDTAANDTYFAGYQYNLKEKYGISVQSAWEAGLNGEGVTVAVIDSGLNYSHTDAPAHIARGRAFYYKEVVDGLYSITVNGVTKQYNYYGNSNTTAIQDDMGHGSMVTGIIAAKTGNKFSIAGIAPEVTIIPIKCFTQEKGKLGGYVSNLISGIEFAVNNGADIINMSWGVKSRSTALEQVITKAANAGCILVAAAGNDGSGGKGVVQYPAGFSNVISVGATNEEGKLAWYSQRNEMVDVCAPGSKIYSTSASSNTKTAYASGTSFAAPAVAAAIALMKESDVTLTQGDVMELLKESCAAVTAIEDSTDAAENFAGAGRLNLATLLTAKGHSGIKRKTDAEGVTVQGSFYPTTGQGGTEGVVILLCGYNAKGHLLQSAMTTATAGSFGGYRFAAKMDDWDITTLRAFFLNGGSLQAITEGKECSVSAG